LQRLHRSIAHVTGDVATVRVNVVAVSSESVRHRARRVQSINSAACTVLHAARVCVSRPSPMAKKKKRTRDPDAVTFENPLDDVENQDLEQPRGGGFEEEDDTPTHDVKKLRKMRMDIITMLLTLPFNLDESIREQSNQTFYIVQHRSVVF